MNKSIISIHIIDICIISYSIIHIYYLQCIICYVLYSYHLQVRVYVDNILLLSVIIYQYRLSRALISLGINKLNFPISTIRPTVKFFSVFWYLISFKLLCSLLRDSLSFLEVSHYKFIFRHRSLPTRERIFHLLCLNIEFATGKLVKVI